MKNYSCCRSDTLGEEKRTAWLNSRGSAINSPFLHYPIPCVFLVSSILGRLCFALGECVVSPRVGIANDRVSHIYSGSSELISAGWVSNLPSISHHLHVPEEEPILRVLRVRKCDGVPVMVEDGYFPKRFSYLMSEDLCGSTFEIFRRHGTEPSHFSKIMDICYATKFEAQKLEVRERQALILQKDMAFDQNGDAIHYTKLVINPERYKLTIIM